MQTEQLSKQPAGPSEKSTQLHKHILRLAIAYRAEDHGIDELLKRISKLPAEDKSQQMDSLLSDIVEAVIAHKELQAKQDPFLRFALKLEQLDLSIEDLMPHLEKVLDGDRSTTTAEAFAKAVYQVTNAPDPDATAMAEFCAALPIGEQLKREIFSLKDAVVRGNERLSTVASLETLVNELASEFTQKDHPSPDHPTDPDNIDLETGRTQLLELMNLIEFPKQLRSRANTLRKQITACENRQDLENNLDGVASLIRDMRQSLETEIARLTDFLGTLNRRLDTLDELIDSSSSFHDASLDHRLKLQQDIDQQVDDMRENMETDSTIEQIRTLVSSRINKLSSHLSNYVALETKRQDEAKTQLDQMSQTVHALENQTEKLHKDLRQQQLQLQVDPLTKVLNRSGYDKILHDALQRKKDEKTPFSLAVLDIDHFKSINDEFGHIAGDKVLTNLANQVKTHIRQTDTLCRYGGEEFVILLQDTNGQAAHAVIEKLRVHISECRFHHGETTVPVTISCGVTECALKDTKESIFERADEAMYQAKHSGRNRCIYAD